MQTIYGDKKLTNCPICSSTRIENIFRIPYHKLEQEIPYRGCHLAYVSTYDYDKIYCWDICKDCESLFANPIVLYSHSSLSTAPIIKAKEKKDYASYIYRVNEVMPYIKNFGTLLEVGCSGGQVLELFKDKGWKRIIGVEVNKAVVDYLKERGFEAYFRPFEEDFPEIEDAIVDCVMMHEVVEHLDYPYQAFKNITRMLKKGGVFSMSAMEIGGKLFLRPGENIATSLKALTDVLGKMGIKIIYHKRESGKIRIIGEKS